MQRYKIERSSSSLVDMLRACVQRFQPGISAEEEVEILGLRFKKLLYDDDDLDWNDDAIGEMIEAGDAKEISDFAEKETQSKLQRRESVAKVKALLSEVQAKKLKAIAPPPANKKQTHNNNNSKARPSAFDCLQFH